MRTTIKNRMIIGASLLMMTFSFGITNAAAQTCTQVPTCAELGYTKTSCGLNRALKCPFDQTKLFCGEKKCKPGYIYYSDDTCSENYNADKTVVGVVAISGVFAGAGVIVNIDQPWSAYTWAGAVDACKSVTIGGKTAHLPTRVEGYIIADNYNAISIGLSKIPGSKQFTEDSYWTSDGSDHYGTIYAYYFNPLTGFEAQESETSGRYIRCVFDF
ncbi:MAG: hypothetical protein IJ545_04395 [Alphaproteobacteria bacterium]|nr:hypothetical protein [Alphaproteobacteria bacterium]